MEYFSSDQWFIICKAPLSIKGQVVPDQTEGGLKVMIFKNEVH